MKSLLNSPISSSIKTHQSSSPFLVHYSVSTFSASDWTPGIFLIFTLDKYISLAAALVVEHLSERPLLVPPQLEEASLLSLSSFLS